MDNKKTGRFIAERRKEMKLSQKQLAEKLNITDKAVSKWETGNGAPDISLLTTIADEINVTVVEIIAFLAFFKLAKIQAPMEVIPLSTFIVSINSLYSSQGISSSIVDDVVFCISPFP